MMIFFHLNLILGSWQKVKTEPVCFGAKNNNYGAFNITKSGLLKGMKLLRKSGWVKCNTDKLESYWGCINERLYGNNDLMTIITNAKKEAILPPAGDLIALDVCNKHKHFYSLDGVTHTSRELVYRDLLNKVSVSRNQEMQIWYGQDWIDCSEDNNNGRTCVDVYAWYD